MKRYWKVFRVVSGSRLVSFFSTPGQIRYRKRGYTERPLGQGPLAAFRSLDMAEEFVAGNGSLDNAYVIYVVTGAVSRAHNLWWKKGTYTQYFNDLPRGTILLDRVRLLEKEQP